MSDDNQAAANLAPRGWRNWTRSRRGNELRRDLAAVDESLVVTDWWETDEPDDAS
ncbi:hypothetical protein [Curtobacterium sp. MCBA15_004]|uniref:hypothetical protein n=1 Tax=Curtobacterium sp. MCBA15_004 TaxID=1898733 RepID=UPI00158768A4|nr:hypothetical protein [Curtobacterium sp. MCBA15_004]WIA96447.1 hypothetical protein QOL16_15315 [Curtobacterium sp. MCBA15_004]